MKRNRQFIVLGLTLAGMASLVGCSTMSGGASKSAKSESTASISKQVFGHMPDGTPVDIYTLRNDNGMEARIMTYGGIIQKLTAPDQNGHYADVVLGFDTLNGYTSPYYVSNCTYFGALIGRYANRIAKGRFTLDGATYQLPINDGPNSLHGGIKGFDKRVWKVVKAKVTRRGPMLELYYFSPNGQEGYPGNLKVWATYTLMAHQNALRLAFRAKTDKDTIINLTGHTYFNLAGHGTINHDILMIPSDEITPVDSTLIPTGQFESVTGTPFDFRAPTAVGARIKDDNQQLKYCQGYDMNFVIHKPLGKFGVMARVYDPESGRVLSVYSNEPGIQFYTGNFLNGTMTGKGSWVYQLRDALTLEPQHYPDSPNHPNFPSTELRPGQVYRNVIVYRFSVR